MATGESSGHSAQIRPYDFRNPERLTTGVRQKLQAHQTNLAKVLSGRLSEGLRTNVGVGFEGVTETNASSFLDTPHDPMFSIAPSATGARVLVRMEAALAQAFVERLLGGPGEKREPGRGPTQIEIALLGRTARRIQASLAETGSARGTAGGAPVHLTREKAREFRGKSGIVSSLELTLGEGEGLLQFFYASDEVAEILGIHAEENRTESETSGKDRRLTPEMIGAITLRVYAQFPPSPVQLRDITSLRVGDVLHLDRKLSDEVQVLVGGQQAFLGYPGAMQGAFGVRISRPLQSQLKGAERWR